MKKLYQGTFSVKINVTAYNEEEARDKLWEQLDSRLANFEIWAENFECDENDIEEIQYV